MATIISCSDGSFAPAERLPPTICCASRYTISSLRLRAGLSGRNKPARDCCATPSAESGIDGACLVIVQVGITWQRARQRVPFAHQEQGRKPTADETQGR